MYVNSSSAQQNRQTDFVNARRPMLNAFSGRQQQPLLIRICHWFNVVFITVMAGSGLQILTAYPALGPRGEQYWWYPFQNAAPPSSLRIGGWLEGGRHWHFAIVWFFIANGSIYLCYVVASGEWRRRLFRPGRDAANAARQFAYYIRSVNLRRPRIFTTAFSA